MVSLCQIKCDKTTAIYHRDQSVFVFVFRCIEMIYTFYIWLFDKFVTYGPKALVQNSQEYKHLVNWNVTKHAGADCWQIIWILSAPEIRQQTFGAHIKWTECISCVPQFLKSTNWFFRCLVLFCFACDVGIWPAWQWIIFSLVLIADAYLRTHHIHISYRASPLHTHVFEHRRFIVVVSLVGLLFYSCVIFFC